MSGTQMHMWNKRRALVVLGSGMLLAAAGWGQAPPKYTLTNAAGNGSSGFEGDGSAATGAKINYPMGLAVDSSGNLYIADQVNHRIRKVVPGGTISTVAGKGTPAFSGNDAAATSAEFSAPCGIAVDSSGNLYVADTQNHEIRKVAQGGNITRFAGTNVAGFLGDGADAKSAQLNLPTGIALDSSGNLYIADTMNNRIRKVGTDGKISTVAGNGASGFSGDGGAATSARLNHPTGVAVDSAGRLYIADQVNHRIRRVSTDGIITTIAGIGVAGFSGDGGQATKAELFYPCCVAVDGSANVFFSDTTNNRLRRISESGTINVVAGSGKFGDEGDGDVSTNARLKFPTGLAVASGKVYFSDNQNSRIKLLSPVTVPPTVDEPPVISEGGVVTETAFGAFSTMAPGSWIEIYGSNLGSATREWNDADFDGTKAPTALEGTRVTIDGQAAYISYVSPDHLKVQVPSLVGIGEKQITVTTDKGESSPVTVTVNSTQPGLQAPASFRVGDKQFVAAVLEDGTTYALPEGSVEGTATRPARPGETITLFGAGFGPVTPNVDAGETTQMENALTLPVQVMFGETPASLSYAGLAPGKVGLYQFKVVVPHMSETGVLPLRFSLDGNAGGQTLYIAVQNAEQN